MKQVIALLVTAMLFACGGEPDDMFVDDEFGTLAQGMSGANTPTATYGTQTGTARQRCSQTATGQVCSVPASKTMTYCVERFPNSNGFTNPEIIDANSFIEFLDGIQGWTFNPTPLNPQGSCAQPGGQFADIYLQSGPVGSSGTASNNIKDYSTVSFIGTITNLTEGASVVGQRQSHTKCTITIDRTDILAKGGSSASNVMSHAVAHAVLGCLGIGGRGDDSRPLASKATVTTGLVNNTLTAAEVCQLQNYVSSGSPNYDIAPVGCNSD